MAVTTDDVMGAIPKGVIFPWASKETTLPKGWALCDGNHGTPNLEGLFLRGTADLNDIGNIGGSTSQQHNHTVEKTASFSGDGFNGDGNCRIGLASTVTIDVTPPFYTVQYIIKV